MNKFGFIGTGNMGGALATAISKNTDSMVVSDKDKVKSSELAEKLKCKSSDVEDVAKNCKYIFLGVKPQVIKNLLMQIAPVLKSRKDRFILVTMAAGVKINYIADILEMECPIIRIMPNTPVSVGEGMILYTSNNFVSETELSDFVTSMSEAGNMDKIQENLIDAACALSGCGPAYVYLFIEAMADAGVECGLPRDKALRYAEQTILGSAKLAIVSKQHPGKLKDDVCSPGGTTIAGVHALENCGFRAAAMNAVTAAYNKTLEMGK